MARKKKYLKKSKGMPTVLALFMIAVVAAAAFFGFLFVQTKLDHDKILEHVTVAGVDVGGMTTQEAADAIRNATAHTYGKQALVTELLKEQIDAGVKYDRVIAIGPVIMMKFVWFCWISTV